MPTPGTATERTSGASGVRLLPDKGLARLEVVIGPAHSASGAGAESRISLGLTVFGGSIMAAIVCVVLAVMVLAVAWLMSPRAD